MQTDHGFVPDDLVFLVDFLNSTYPGTVDHLGSTALFGAWLVEHGRGSGVTADQLATATAVREGLRAAAVGNAGVEPDDGAIAAAERALAGVPVRVSVRDPGSPLLPAGSGTDAVMGEVAVALAAARLSGRWNRVKACTGEDCGFVFWDGSRNGSRRWCDMQRCGSREKMRTYRARTAPHHAGRRNPATTGHDGAERPS
jgi:predicted RNA-binding Zn ribbon-like protein